MSENIVEMKSITKKFSGVVALNNVHLKVRKGTVHALMGENGAGKSTLMNILAGVLQPDSGQINIDNKTNIQLKNPNDAMEHGVSMIHQELTPIKELSIAENIYLGKEPINSVTKLIDYNEMYKMTSGLLKQLDLNLDPKMKVKNLSMAHIQMIEIAKALSIDSKLIIMDEPTSSLVDKEANKLFEIISMLKKQNKGIIYVSHKMNEIFEISDDITVLRDGNYIDSKSINDVEENKLIHMMVGRELKQLFPKQESKVNEDREFLKVMNLSREGFFENISFTLKKGEILGFAGLIGAGRSEVVETIFGITKSTGGTIEIDNEFVKITKPTDAIKHNLAFVTEDRAGEGLFLPLSISENTSIMSLKKIMKKGFISKEKEKSLVDSMIELLNIKSYSRNQIVETLSGGNQQKVVIAKWLLTSPKILILDEPTRGIDIGAKVEIYNLMNELVNEGFSVILISSDMEEVINMSDRIIVFHEGKITGEVSNKDANQEIILEYATGIKNDSGDYVE